MSEEKRNTGIGHDDDGNLDDRRIAAWVLMIAILGLAWFGIQSDTSFTVEIFQGGVWASVALFGSTVAEKFKRN